MYVYPHYQMHSGSIWINGRNDSRRDSPDGANDNRPYMKNVETRLIVPRVRKRALASTLSQERDGGGGDACKLYIAYVYMCARARGAYIYAHMCAEGMLGTIILLPHCIT
jgi:hypothetical protein